MSHNLPPNPDKHIKDLSKGDLTESLRFGNWFANLWSNGVSDFIGCSIKRVYSLRKTYTGYYYRNIICLSILDFLKERGFKMLDEYVINSDDFSSVTKKEIEISKGKFTEVTVEGSMFLEKLGKKFIVGMHEGYRPNEWDINISYNREDHTMVKAFLTDLEDFAKKQCYLKNAKIDPDLSFIKLNKDYSWQDIVLPKYIKDEITLNTTKLVDSINFYKKHNLPFKRGLILEGSPGTGKTLIGRIICSTINCSFLWVTPKFLVDSRAIASICELSREIAPCVLFLEDLDLYASDRDNNRDSGLLGELMNQLDGLVENNYVIVIATTNRVKFIEEALSNRPGRFDRTIEIPRPSEEGRKRLLTLCLNNIKTESNFINEIATKTEDFTGAHIQELVNTAIMVAIEDKSFDKEDNVILKKEFLINNIEKVKNKKLEPSVGFITKNHHTPQDHPDLRDVFDQEDIND